MIHDFFDTVSVVQGKEHGSSKPRMKVRVLPETSDVAQLVEHLPDMQAVVRANRAIRTLSL